MKLKSVTTIEAVRVNGQYETFMDSAKYELNADDAFFVTVKALNKTSEVVCVPFSNVKQFTSDPESKPVKAVK